MIKQNATNSSISQIALLQKLIYLLIKLIKKSFKVKSYQMVNIKECIIQKYWALAGLNGFGSEKSCLRAKNML